MYMEKLEEMRESRGLSQRQLGDILGVSAATISNYETGRREPPFETLCAMADFFGVSLDMLISGKEKTRSNERVKEDLKAMVEAMPTPLLRYASALIALELTDREYRAGQDSTD